MRSVPFAAALLAGVAAATLAPGALAAAKRPPETLTCAVTGGAFRSATSGTAAGGPESQLVISPLQTFYSLRGTMQRRSRKGVVVSRSIELRVLPAKDPRTPGSLPATFRAGSGVGGSWSVATTTDADPVGTVQVWNVDDTGVVPFTVTWKKFDPVTSRLSGVFAGQMASAEVGGRNVRFKAGKFSVVAHVDDLLQPPAQPAE